MRVLLDECVDRRLARELHGHEVHTVTGLGWAGNLAFQQQIDKLALAVVILRARSNRLADLRPLVPALLRALSQARAGEVVWVDG